MASVFEALDRLKNEDILRYADVRDVADRSSRKDSELKITTIQLYRGAGFTSREYLVFTIARQERIASEGGPYYLRIDNSMTRFHPLLSDADPVSGLLSRVARDSMRITKQPYGGIGFHEPSGNLLLGEATFDPSCGPCFKQLVTILKLVQQRSCVEADATFWSSRAFARTIFSALSRYRWPVPALIRAPDPETGRGLVTQELELFSDALRQEDTSKFMAMGFAYAVCALLGLGFALAHPSPGLLQFLVAALCVLLPLYLSTASFGGQTFIIYWRTSSEERMRHLTDSIKATCGCASA